MGCETILKKNDRLITKKEISIFPEWGNYRYEISKMLILYSDEELNVGDTLKFIKPISNK